MDTYFDTKLVLEVLAERLKTALPSLLSSNQTVYLNYLLKLKGLLLTVDTEKAFDSENYRFSQDFLKWISILVQNQEPCVVNGGKTTRYFLLK